MNRETISQQATNVEERAAAEWLVLLETGNVDRATREAFLAWLNAAPEHEADYEQCEAILAVAENLARYQEIESACERDGVLGASSAMLARCRAVLAWITRPGLRTALAALAIIGIVLGPLTFTGTAPDDAGVFAPGQSGDAPAGTAEPLGNGRAQAADELGNTLDQTDEDVGALQVELPLRQVPAQPSSSPDSGEPAPDRDSPPSTAARDAVPESDCIARVVLADLRRAVEVRLRESRAQLDLLLRRYTERHPEVVSMRRDISVLEARLTELSERASAEVSGPDQADCVEARPQTQGGARFQ
jgi:hypothetical protein